MDRAMEACWHSLYAAEIARFCIIVMVVVFYQLEAKNADLSFPLGLSVMAFRGKKAKEKRNGVPKVV